MDYLALVVINFLDATLGAIVYLRNRKSLANRLFLLFIISVVFWSVSNFIVDKTLTYFDAFLWTKITFISSFFIPPLLFLFTNNFPTRKANRRTWIHLLPAGLLSVLSLFGLVISGVGDISKHPISPVFGPLYYPFVAYFIIYIFVALKNIFSSSRKEIGIKRLQIRYLFLGLFFSTIFAALTNLILPFFGNSSLSNYGIYGLIVFIATTFYAITRHRLFDIRLVVTRSLIYGSLLAVVSLALISVTIISSQFFGGTATSRNMATVVVAALIIFGLDPFRNFLSRATDRIFFKAKVDYQELLRGISESLSFEINRDELIKKIRIALKDGLKVGYAVTLLRKTAEGATEKFEALPDMLKENKNYYLLNNSALIGFLREHRHPSLLDALQRKIDDTPEDKRQPLIASQQEFERMGGALAAPIYAQGHLIAVLVLGPKLSGDTFSNEDLQMLEVLAPQIGSAIQKANLFEEVRQFGESLKAKVEEATAELQERNVSLETLQNITKDITRRLDFNQVVQNIADSVATKLGYLGSILVFLDDDGQTVRARAITQTPLTKRALDILPIKFTDYTTNLNDPKSTSLGHQVLRNGEIATTESFADVVSPPLPRVLAGTIQKLIGIKSMVLIPIVAEGKTIGVIEIGTKKNLKDIDQTEIATMQAMADELGIVARNIQLFQQLRVTNDQLGVANEHLKELDQAKSEFVSIASHQLRTPMTGIMGYLSMMTQGDFGKMAPEHKKILSDLLSESQRMIRLINQFLNVSKIEAGKFAYTKKSGQIEDSIDIIVRELTKNATDKGLKLIWKRPKEPLPLATFDPDKLADVILNLIDNAIKYTTKGSITVTAAAEGDSIHVRVKDTGVGIKPADAGQLFNKFVRGSGIAKIQPGGSGLGLFIAKSVIDSHGGRIWTESEGEGKGSTFQFTIPINPPSGSEPHPLNAAAHVAKPRGTVENFLGTK